MKTQHECENLRLFCSKLASLHSCCATLHDLFVNRALVIVADIGRGFAGKRRATMSSGEVLFSGNSILVRVKNPGSRVIVRKRKHQPQELLHVLIPFFLPATIAISKKGRAASLSIRACLWHHRCKQCAMSVDKQYRACKRSTAAAVASTIIRLAPKENIGRLAFAHALFTSETP